MSPATINSALASDRMSRLAARIAPKSRSCSANARSIARQYSGLAADSISTSSSRNSGVTSFVTWLRR